MKTNTNVYAAIAAFLLYSVYNFVYLGAVPGFGGDENRFIREAVHFAQFGEFRVGDFWAWEMPFTGVLYGMIYFFAGSEAILIYVVRLLQSILLILQAYMIARIAMMIFKDQRVATIAFIWMLFYPYFIYYQALLLSETLFNTFLIGAFYFLYRWKNEGFVQDRSFFLFLVLLSVGVYVKATLVFLVPLLAPLFFLVFKWDFIRGIKLFILSLVVYAALLSPWWIRNYLVFDTYVPFTTTSGWNLYLGNNSHNEKGGCDWTQDVDPVRAEQLKRIDDEVVRNKAFANEAKEFILNNPERFIELAWYKFLRFYAVIPNAEKFSQGLYMWISIFTFGPVLLFSVFGIYSARKKWRTLTPMFLLITYFTLIHMMVIASLRYRLPLEPFMILLASHAIIGLLNNIKEHWNRQFNPHTDNMQKTDLEKS